MLRGYTIPIIRDTDSNSIRVIYPGSVLEHENPEDKIVKYTITETSVRRSINGLSPITVKSPKYLSRVLVAADLLLYTIKTGYSTSLFECPEEEEAFMMLDGPTDNEDIEKESACKLLFQRIVLGHECASLVRSNDIEEGYNLLVDVTTSGGF